MRFLPFVLSALVAGLVSAQAAPAENEVPRLPHGARSGGTCTITKYSQVGQIKNCQTVVLNNLAVPAGQTLNLNLRDGAHLTFAGTTSFGYKEWEGPLLSMTGNGVTVTAAKGAVIDGDGPQYWDGKGGKGKKKPKFFRMSHMTNSHVNGVTVRNTPVQAFSITNVNNLFLDHITVDNRLGDTKGGHNTDAFDVANSDGVYITNPTVYNQDDCLAINSGKNTFFSGGTCSGGHGISIGSVAQGSTVSGVHVENSHVVNSANGIRIKTVENATGGAVNNVTYTGITLENIRNFGMVIEQDYSKKTGGPSGHPTAGIPITDVTINNIRGSVAAKASPLNIVCAPGGCKDWHVSGFGVTGGRPSSKCQNVPAGLKC